MKPTEAKSVLEVESDEPEEIKDRYEEAVFQLLQIFLKDPVIPTILLARMEKLKTLSEAYQVLIPSNSPIVHHTLPTIPLNGIPTWKEFFNQYERNKATIRTFLSSSLDSVNLKIGLETLLKHELEYREVILSHTTLIALDLEVKISEPVPVVEILKECENLRNRGMINESIESLNEISDKNATFNLSKEVNRLRKIVKNG